MTEKNNQIIFVVLLFGVKFEVEDIAALTGTKTNLELRAERGDGV